MKKEFYHIFLLAILLFTFGCNPNNLDVTPDGRISLDEVFSNVKMTESYLNSCYAYTNYGGTRYFFFAALAGLEDSFFDSDYTEGLMATDWYNGKMTSNDDPLGNSGTSDWNGYIWDRYWEGIRKCNVFIKNIETAPVEKETNRTRFRVEATVLRDWYLFELCKKYGPLPTVTEPFSLDFDFTKLTRPTFQEVADFIAKDMDQAIAVDELPWRFTSSAERGRMTKAIAITLKSQVQLYAASPLHNTTNDQTRWVKARDYAKDAVSKLTAQGFQLYYKQELGAKSFYDYFINQQDLSQSPKDRETIYEPWADQPTYGGRMWHINGFPTCTAQFKAGSCPTQELVDAFDMQSTGLPVIDPVNRYKDSDHLNPNYMANSGYDANNPYAGRDPRFYATVIYNGAYEKGVDQTVWTYVGGNNGIQSNSRKHTFTGYYTCKYWDREAPGNTSCGGFWKKMRLAELYLNWAEAENEVNGPNAEVYSIVKVIRDRVEMPNIKAGITSKDEMRSYIQKERMTEFAFEEQRFWDVRRWKILDKTDKLVTGMKIIKNDDNSFNYNRFVIGYRKSWSEKFLLFPIPVGESSIMGPEWQNPGW